MWFLSFATSLFMPLYLFFFSPHEINIFWHQQDYVPEKLWNFKRNQGRLSGTKEKPLKILIIKNNILVNHIILKYLSNMKFLRNFIFWKMSPILRTSWYFSYLFWSQHQFFCCLSQYFQSFIWIVLCFAWWLDTSWPDGIAKKKIKTELAAVKREKHHLKAGSKRKKFL